MEIREGGWSRCVAASSKGHPPFLPSPTMATARVSCRQGGLVYILGDGGFFCFDCLVCISSFSTQSRLDIYNAFFFYSSCSSKPASCSLADGPCYGRGTNDRYRTPL